MKISKEVKVGVLGLVGLIILYYGFNFLKGSEIFSSTKEYQLSFKDAMGLEVSNTVNYKGVVVGRVTKITPDYKGEKIDVVVALQKQVEVTDNSEIILADDGLIGGKLLILDIQAGKPLAVGSTIKTKTEMGLLSSVTEMVNPTLKKADSLLVTLNIVAKEFENSGQALKVLLASATQSTTGLNGIMASNSKNLNTITGNAAVLTADLNKVVKNLDQQLKPILANMNSFTDSLSAIELNTTMDKLDLTMASLQSIVNDINKGKGTLGKLTTDEALYANLSNTAASLNLLMVDLQRNPRRYVHFSLFGGKDKSKKVVEVEKELEKELETIKEN